MGEIVLGLITSHSPLLSVPVELWTAYAERDKRNPNIYRVPDGKHMTYEDLLAEADPAIAKEITEEKFKARHEANQKGIAKVAEALAKAKPDVLIMFGDDQQEIFTKDVMPALCVFWGEKVPFAQRERGFGSDDAAMRAVSEAYGGDGVQEYPVNADLSLHIIESLNAQEFDVMHMRALEPDKMMSHAFGFVWRRIMSQSGIIPTVPIHVNTYYPPNQPTPQRCYQLGRAIRAAVESWDSDTRVAVIASGGASHFVVDEEVDRQVLKVIQEKDEAGIAALPLNRLQAGTSENRTWIAAAGVAEDLDMELFDYVPCYRTPAGTGCAMAFAQWT
ncbi:MAG: hypothetical protein O7D33_06430 [Chloroflexi bacterium]|nr:hypothetical protein [Chloroflexota bacterium]